MGMEELIEINPKIMAGKPVIRGTRVTVDLVVGKLAAGESVDDLLLSYPHLRREQILACLEYAHRSLSMDFVFPVTREAG